MSTWIFGTSRNLIEASRFDGILRVNDRIRFAELAILFGCGAAAAFATTFLEFRLRIPGHAIVRSVIPITLGLALVPRRGSGTAMTAVSLLWLAMFAELGAKNTGSGALTSLALVGPSLDLAASVARGKLGLPIGFAMAGLITNLIALAARLACHALGWEKFGNRQNPGWWPYALATYALCGLMAGLLASICWFRIRGNSANRSGGEGE